MPHFPQITRRNLALAMGGGLLATRAQADPQPASAGDAFPAMSLRRAADVVAKVKIPRQTQPAFRFQP